MKVFKDFLLKLLKVDKTIKELEQENRNLLTTNNILKNMIDHLKKEIDYLTNITGIPSLLSQEPELAYKDVQYPSPSELRLPLTFIATAKLNEDMHHFILKFFIEEEKQITVKYYITPSALLGAYNSKELLLHVCSHLIDGILYKAREITNEKDREDIR